MQTMRDVIRDTATATFPGRVPLKVRDVRDPRICSNLHYHASKVRLK